MPPSVLSPVPPLTSWPGLSGVHMTHNHFCHFSRGHSLWLHEFWTKGEEVGDSCNSLIVSRLVVSRIIFLKKILEKKFFLPEPWIQNFPVLSFLERTTNGLALGLHGASSSKWFHYPSPASTPPGRCKSTGSLLPAQIKP